MSTTNLTNQPTYISLRLTIPHSDVSILYDKIIHDVDEWCVYKHGGSNTGIAEHVHVAIVGGNCERIRKRLRDNIGGGNKVYSVKQFTNDVRGFVFYCSHEGSIPDFKGDKWPVYIQEIQEGGGYQKRKMTDHFVVKDKKEVVRSWTLTYTNLVLQAVAHHKRYRLDTDSLKKVVLHMWKNTNWAPSRDVRKNGIGRTYQMEFEMRIGKRDEMPEDCLNAKDEF